MKTGKVLQIRMESVLSPRCHGGARERHHEHDKNTREPTCGLISQVVIPLKSSRILSAQGQATNGRRSDALMTCAPPLERSSVLEVALQAGGACDIIASAGPISVSVDRGCAVDAVSGPGPQT